MAKKRCSSVLKGKGGGNKCALLANHKGPHKDTTGALSWPNEAEPRDKQSFFSSEEAPPRPPRCTLCRRTLLWTVAKESLTCQPSCPGPPLKGPDYEAAEIKDRDNREKRS